MTEKQRLLLRELQDWQTAQMKRIGNYGPPREPKTPERVVAARKAIKRHEATTRAWEEQKKAPWKKQRDAIDARAARVKRAILFEKTEAALKALKSLPAKGDK